MIDLDATLAALAEPTRRAVVDLLRERPRRAGELAAALEISPPAMSRHLKVLRRARIIDEKHDGDDARARIYRLEPEAFGALRRWVEDVESFWGRELDAFKTYAESKRKRPR